MHEQVSRFMQPAGVSPRVVLSTFSFDMVGGMYTGLLKPFDILPK